MSINEKRQALSQGSAPRVGIGRPALPPPPKTPPDTSIFQGKTAIPMRDAAWEIRKDTSQIPGTGGARFSRIEKGEMLKHLQKKYGSFLEKKEISPILKDFAKAKTKAPTGVRKQQIDRQIRYWRRKLTGI